jgi:hypothetical protein
MWMRWYLGTYQYTLQVRTFREGVSPRAKTLVWMRWVLRYLPIYPPSDEFEESIPRGYDLGVGFEVGTIGTR